jgi:hypothetical protein
MTGGKPSLPPPAERLVGGPVIDIINEKTGARTLVDVLHGRSGGGEAAGTGVGKNGRLMNCWLNLNLIHLFQVHQSIGRSDSRRRMIQHLNPKMTH